MLVFILETNQDSGECLMEIFVAHLFVMPWGMMFGEVVRHVGRTLSPQKLKLFLLDAVFDPVEAHIKSFRELLTHGWVEDACGGGVVVEYWCTVWRLGVTEFG